jgi:hypothetical protein
MFKKDLNSECTDQAQDTNSQNEIQNSDQFYECEQGPKHIDDDELIERYFVSEDER